jgi:hypothetical protein
LQNQTPQDAQRLARCGINAFLHTSGGTTRLVGRVTFGANGPGRPGGSSLDRRRLSNFLLTSIDRAVAHAMAAPVPAAAASLADLESQLRRFFEQLHRHRALAGKRPEQAFYLRLAAVGTDGPQELRFGIALAQAARFSDYRITFDSGAAGSVQAAQSLEADQLFS